MRNKPKTLYHPLHEHGSCGTGFVVQTDNSASHRIVELAIEAVTNLTHRGAVSADMKTGDGAGILTQIPRKFFERELRKQGIPLPRRGDLGVAMVFLPGEPELRQRCRTLLEKQVFKSGLRLLGWRKVPVIPDALGRQAQASRPDIQQLFVARGESISKRNFEKTLYLVRKAAEKRGFEASLQDFYLPSFSSRTLVYKGLLVALQLKEFYPDLADPLFKSSFALFHQRFSTNTFPTWQLAQPFRLVAHNGEINTIQGNRHWMLAREREFLELPGIRQPAVPSPIVVYGGSDSASLDNVLEALVMAGRDVLQATTLMLPEAWEQTPAMDPKRRAYFEYNSCLMEPWDGPAAITFADGLYVGAILDRNGLRPSRYFLTEDGLLVLGSEVGMIPVDPAKIVKRGRLGPGQMIAVDLKRHKILEDDAIKDQLALRRPYPRWVEKRLWRFPKKKSQDELQVPVLSAERRHRLLSAMGYTQEEMAMLLKPMAVEGKEPTFSMGDDTPLAVLSKHARPLYAYFKQLFAQVTNPPIDPLREKSVMALHTYLGPRGNVFKEGAGHAALIQLESPILDEMALRNLIKNRKANFKTEILFTRFRADRGPREMEEALLSLCEAAAGAVRQGKSLLFLSDREINREYARIPMLLAVGAVHHHLIREGLRMRAGMVADTGEVRDVHHFACLIGYGAQGICPYLAFAAVRAMAEENKLDGLISAAALRNFKTAVEAGLYKIMSKMGISTLSSYLGAQIFEVLGLKQALINRYFTGTFSKAGGIGLEEIAEDVLTLHRRAFGGDKVLPLHAGGLYRFRREGEYHAFNPEVVRTLTKAAHTGNYEDYRAFAKTVQERPPTTLRDLLDFKEAEPIPLDEVEPVEAILHRFNTASISFGALSREAHRNLAIAMNRLGAKSGSGEGGEDTERFLPLPNGDNANSKIKQVASARFGVRASYLAYAEELEIKMAQGSKPGEGGQLPGKKVSVEIARLRHATPGITLISPPPHHDIYSIEDLAQLIYDLKAANPRAKVGVKLVAEAGVGTIAAGVAKAHADVILISGHDGGTGASPLSSIKNAGSAWELGLAETQQTLVLNDLRGKVTLRTDGGMKTGRDVVMAALLGAEEYGFGTAAMISAGCCMVRQCHLNTCPVGVATQDPHLREKFKGTPEGVIHYFTGVAQEVREILARLGKRSLQEIIGCPELLQPHFPKTHPRAKTLRLGNLLQPLDPAHRKARVWAGRRNDWDDRPLNHRLLADVVSALDGKGSLSLSYEIKNTDRAVGAGIAGEIGKRYLDQGLPPGSEIELKFKGSAGQSFGAWMTKGMRLLLEGEANDYVGKGMSGGEMVVLPPREAGFAAEENVLIGNTCFYGATGGRAFICGRAGERCGVRNSGGVLVVEGVGDHGCEYMTGGILVCLGPTGKNFGAGMTGGEAYVLDETRGFENRLNPELVSLEKVENTEPLETLAGLLRRHVEVSGSKLAEKILKNFGEYQHLFWRVVPKPAKASEAAEVIPLRAGKEQGLRK